MDAGSIILMDLLWYVAFFQNQLAGQFREDFYVIAFICRSDPTENDSVEGLRPNARGPGLVTFGVCPAFLDRSSPVQLGN